MLAESDLGDIIYLIAIVVFGIIGALGKKKKKRKPFFSGDATEPEKPGFWDELKNEMQSNFEEEETIETVNEEQTIRPDVMLGQDQPIISSPLEKQKSYTYSQERLENESIEYADRSEEEFSKAMSSNKTRKLKDGLKLNLDSVDELTKGIIYAEIFNRKYN